MGVVGRLEVGYEGIEVEGWSRARIHVFKVLGEPLNE